MLADSERPIENLRDRTEPEHWLAGGGRGGAEGRVTVTGTVRTKFFLFANAAKRSIIFLRRLG